jgi:hypothetical protein
MNILVVVENSGFNRKLAKEVGRLAANTWANITLLGYLPSFQEKALRTLQENIIRYREAILTSFPEDSSPYPQSWSEKWQEKGENLFIASDSGQKFLDLIVSKFKKNLGCLSGIRKKRIDLLILGNRSDYQSPLVARVMETDGSLLVVKGTEDPQQIVCCLDHDQVSHNSLEMINQLVTLYGAELKIVGFAKGGQNQNRIESCLQGLLNYYSVMKITPWLELVDASIKAQFLVQESQKNLVALWCEKKNANHGSMLGREEIAFLKEAATSVLVLQ